VSAGTRSVSACAPEGPLPAELEAAFIAALKDASPAERKRLLKLRGETELKFRSACKTALGVLSNAKWQLEMMAK